MHHTIDPVRTLDELLRVLKCNGHLTLGVYCWRFPYTGVSWIFRRIVGKTWDVKCFLKFAGQNKLLLLLADFMFVPIEHTLKEKRLSEYLRSKNCEIMHNDMMLWPVGLPEPFSRFLHILSGLNYRHIILKKQTSKCSIRVRFWIPLWREPCESGECANALRLRSPRTIVLGSRLSWWIGTAPRGTSGGPTTRDVTPRSSI